jgi:putative ABC transport system permease protein
MGALAQNFGFSMRQLRKAPGFTLTVVLTLALGIGATTAMFSLVEGVLLRPLPFRDPDRLVLIGDHLGGNPGVSITAREIGIYSAASQAFSSLGGYIATSYELSGRARPEQVQAARFSFGVFPTLGVEPALGRVFTEKEEESRQPVAVISYSLWVDHFHRDPNILGSAVVLDRRPYTIIGVMPRDFEFPIVTGRLNQAKLWVPMSLTADEVSDQRAGFWGFELVGRLKDGVTAAQASQDASRIAQLVTKSFPPNMSAIRIQGDVVLLREWTVSDVRPLLRTLFLSVAIVLLIACVNVAGLLLVRAVRRRREYALRLALGANSRAIVTESIFEGLVISVPAGLLGLGLAAIAIRTALHLLPESMPRISAISMDTGVIGFSLVLAVVTGTLCSLAPAFAALRTNLSESLKEGAKAVSGGSSHEWLRSALVVSEIAVALILLTLSGAFLRSFQKMRAVNPGFRPDHVLVAAYQLPLNQYSTEMAVQVFNRAVVDRLAAKPGVAAAGITDILPATGAYRGAAYTIEGLPEDTWKLQFAHLSTTYGDFFSAMGIPLLEGRYFNTDDRADSAPVVIVNQSMAKHCWPGQSPIGKRMHVGNPHKGYPWATVVGIVADTASGSRDEPSVDQWYVPAQQPATVVGLDDTGRLSNPAGGYITLRATMAPEQMVRVLRAAVAEVDPLLALDQVQPMDEVISNVEAPRRFNTDLITAFALGALLLAITGIYAVVAFSVSLRRQEIAIRMALGAQRGGIARLVLVGGAKLALLGCVLGLLGSVAISRLVSSFLFNVSATDPVVYLIAGLTMMAMALVASALPATRAASADPMDALRAS